MPRLRWFVAALAALVVPAIVCAEVAEAGPRRVIPEVVDLPQAQAEGLLQAAGFRARAVPSSAPGARGTVAAQSPGGFWYAETGTEVTIEVRGLAGGAPTPGPTPGPSVPGPVPPGTGVPPAADVPVLPTVGGRTEEEALDALNAGSVKVD